MEKNKKKNNRKKERRTISLLKEMIASGPERGKAEIFFTENCKNATMEMVRAVCCFGEGKGTTARFLVDSNANLIERAMNL